MQSISITAVVVALLLLQALLLPLGIETTGIAERAAKIGAGSWRGLAMYVAVVSTMGHWSYAGARSFAELETGKRLIFIATMIATLPLWAFVNGLLDDDVIDMIALSLLPVGALLAGAAMSKDWRDMLRVLVIGIGTPLASLLFLATFVDFAN
jgi:hypothetical protein